MKLAEALALRSDLQKRLEQLKQRLVKNARIQEGDTLEEQPAELQAEFEKSAGELTLLIQRINRTNAQTPFGAGTLADSLAERDILKIRYSAYRELATAASTSQGRTTRSEVKFVSTVSVAATQRKADDLAREYRELDTRIQEADWLTTLVGMRRAGSWRDERRARPHGGAMPIGDAGSISRFDSGHTAYAPYCVQTHGVVLPCTTAC